MIEQDVYAYFKQSTTLSGLLGGTEKVFLVQVPQTYDDSKMPWVIVEKTSGSRTKISQTLMEEVAYLRVSVDAGPAQMFAGFTLIDECKRLLENYRGEMNGATDVYSVTSAVRDWAGFGGSYRYQFDATVRYTEPFSQP